MLCRLEGSDPSRAAWAIALSRMRGANPSTVSVRRSSLLSRLAQTLVILSRRARYGLIALAMTALVIPSIKGTLQVGQNTRDRKDAQDKDLAGAQGEADDTALQDFLRAYRLAAGQNLKRIEPPRPIGAAVWWKRKFAANGGTGPQGFGAMVFRYGDPDHLENYGGLFGPATQGYPVRNLPEAIGMDVDPAEIEGDPALLQSTVTGDWIFREGVPPVRMVDSLESILQRGLRLRIRLTFRQVERDVVVARGQYHYLPLPGRSKNEIDLYGHQLVKNKNATSGTGDLPNFLKSVGGFIGRPVVNEVETPPKEPISWFNHVRSPFTERMRQEDHDEALVLQHIQEQTGLTFRREMKPIRVMFIERAE